jgi:hypothetical protein
MFLLCLVGVASGLGGCSDPVNCSGLDYRSACVPGPAEPAPARPAAANPATIDPATISPGPVAPPGVGLGDPGQFADVDDRQCRSYGLKFGTHDYADCRIRLSAQHRGLDPNIGVPANR